MSWFLIPVACCTPIQNQSDLELYKRRYKESEKELFKLEKALELKVGKNGLLVRHLQQDFWASQWHNHLCWSKYLMAALQENKSLLFVFYVCRVCCGKAMLRSQFRVMCRPLSVPVQESSVVNKRVWQQCKRLSQACFAHPLTIYFLTPGHCRLVADSKHALTSWSLLSTVCKPLPALKTSSRPWLFEVLDLCFWQRDQRSETPGPSVVQCVMFWTCNLQPKRCSTTILLWNATLHACPKTHSKVTPQTSKPLYPGPINCCNSIGLPEIKTISHMFSPLPPLFVSSWQLHLFQPKLSDAFVETVCAVLCCLLNAVWRPQHYAMHLPLSPPGWTTWIFHEFGAAADQDARGADKGSSEGQVDHNNSSTPADVRLMGGLNYSSLKMQCPVDLVALTYSCP